MAIKKKPEGKKYTIRLRENKKIAHYGSYNFKKEAYKRGRLLIDLFDKTRTVTILKSNEFTRTSSQVDKMIVDEIIKKRDYKDRRKLPNALWFSLIFNLICCFILAYFFIDGFGSPNLKQYLSLGESILILIILMVQTSYNILYNTSLWSSIK